MNEKLQLAMEILAKSNIDFWHISSYENKGGLLKKFGLPLTFGNLFLAKDGRKSLLVSSLDCNNVGSDFSDDEIFVYRRGSDEIEVLNKLMNSLNINKNSKLALNYDENGSFLADFMGAGEFKSLESILNNFYGENSSSSMIVSARNIIFELFERKTDKEIEYLKIAANRANYILDIIFSQIKSGMSDYEVQDLTRKFTQESFFDYFNNNGIVGVVSEEFAWDEPCPIVLTGNGFTKGGHAEASGEIIAPGNTVYFDFGVKLGFEDGSFWSSDLQRMGYVLKFGETKPPEDKQRAFDVLYYSISKGIEALKPGVMGRDVDKVVRSVINKGFAIDYDHATGHPIGEFAHNPGTIIGSKSQGFILGRGVYTLEPRIPIVDGASVEEMVFVNPNGKNFTLCPRQERLYLIK